MHCQPIVCGYAGCYNTRKTFECHICSTLNIAGRLLTTSVGIERLTKTVKHSTNCSIDTHTF